MDERQARAMSSTIRSVGPGRLRRLARAALLACVAASVTFAWFVSWAFAAAWQPDDRDLGVFDPDDPIGF
jgi:hypothetical protein